MKTLKELIDELSAMQEKSSSDTGYKVENVAVAMLKKKIVYCVDNIQIYRDNDVAKAIELLKERIQNDLPMEQQEDYLQMLVKLREALIAQTGRG